MKILASVGFVLVMLYLAEPFFQRGGDEWWIGFALVSFATIAFYANVIWKGRRPAP